MNSRKEKPGARRSRGTTVGGSARTRNSLAQSMAKPFAANLCADGHGLESGETLKKRRAQQPRGRAGRAPCRSNRERTPTATSIREQSYDLRNSEDVQTWRGA